MRDSRQLSRATAARAAPPVRVPSSRTRPSDDLVNLNFKVPAAFRRRFKRLAVDVDISGVELLRRVVEAYERERST